MPGKYCCVCGNSKSKDSNTSFHRFPSDDKRRLDWLKAFQIEASEVKPHWRVCSRHFPDGDAKKSPNPTLGKRFSSPIKKGPRAKRAKVREENRKLDFIESRPSSSKSRSATPAVMDTDVSDVQPVLTASIGEQLETDFSVHELPGGECSKGVVGLSESSKQSQRDIVVDTVLLSRIEFLEAENVRLRNQQEKKVEARHFNIEDICHDNSLVRFYTGFILYALLLAFYEFLGPAVDKLHYWGSKEGLRKRIRTQKLSPLNQFFLTLVKLRLNLKLKDLAFRFGLSTSQTSRYLTTWICFLYHHLKELDWMPTVKQVKGTLPHAFKEKFPRTYAIIDGSEIFIETPSDLHMQSSTWSQYKHHNTTKFLVGCTPNGAICFISPLYAGSISDVQLTRVSGFLEKLQDKPGILIMADRGFTIRDMLNDLNIELNIPPFMEGRQQLSSRDVEEGRKIASLRIHVERAIGRIKTFEICRSTIPLSMTRICNQIVCVCAFLSNFQPALVPPSTAAESNDTDDYFADMDGDESSSDSD